MKKITKKELRKALILKILLDCKKWTRQDIFSKIVTLEKKFYDDYPHVCESSKGKISDSHISRLLNELNNEKIIEKETIPQKRLRGPAGFRYKLVNNYNSFEKFLKYYFIIQYEPNELIFHHPNSKLYYEFSNHFFDTKFAKSMINQNLIFYFVENNFQMGKLIESKGLIKVLKTFPTSLIQAIHYFNNSKALNNEIKRENRKLSDYNIFIYIIKSGAVNDANNIFFKPQLKFEFNSELIIGQRIDEGMLKIESDQNEIIQSKENKTILKIDSIYD